MDEIIIFPDLVVSNLWHYNPPYDSPLEDVFAYHFDKYREPGADLYPQVQVNTICGPYWLDFAIKKGDVVIGIECDGKEYHDGWRDLWRDAMILGTGRVGAIYRFRGRDLNYHVNDCLYLLSQAEPKLFSPRGQTNLRQLSSAEALGATHKINYVSEDGILLFYHKADEDTGAELETSILIERRQKELPKGKRPYWVEFFGYAKRSRTKNLNQIILRYKEERDKKSSG